VTPPAKKRVFIVEDQRIIAADLENTLKKLGYDIAGSAATGEEAVVKVAAVRPDLTLMDIRLGDAMDGIEAATEIRRKLDLPIVYLTAYADEETIVRAKATGPFGYIVKPFNERDLRAAIEIALYKHDTDRVIAEERARRQAAEEFRLIVENVRDYAIFKLEPDGRVATWNTGAERLTGYRADEAIGQHFSIFYPKEAVRDGLPLRMLQLARAEDRAEEEGFRLRKDGSRFWAGSVITALRDEQGRLLGFVKVLHDLSERKQREDAMAEELQRRAALAAENARLYRQAEEAVRARDEFLQAASHELKTPLTPLQLQLDMLTRAVQRAGTGSERLAAKLGVATRQVARLSQLVESLLDVSRITGGRLSLSPSAVDLSEVVRDVAERLRGEAEKAGCQIVVRSSGPLVGQWDRARLEQLLLNLLSNAIKYGEQRPVEVDAAGTDTEVQLTVTDHGIGIDAAALGRIFERFERATPMHHYGGLGLGLFLARQIAEAHGGRIGARSEPGQGSTFTVVLPRLPGHKASSSAPHDGQRETR
jgi:hypothetical protein